MNKLSQYTSHHKAIATNEVRGMYEVRDHKGACIQRAAKWEIEDRYENRQGKVSCVLFELLGLTLNPN